MNLPRFSLFGSVGLPTFPVPVMESIFIHRAIPPNISSNQNHNSSSYANNASACGGNLNCQNEIHVFFDLGGGILSKAFKASLNETPLRIHFNKSSTDSQYA
jgi:hypothetical protein